MFLFALLRTRVPALDAKASRLEKLRWSSVMETVSAVQEATAMSSIPFVLVRSTLAT